MGRSQRQKGQRGERAVCELLRELGYEAHRGLQTRESVIEPDVVARHDVLENLSAEVKLGGGCPSTVYKHLEQAARMAEPGTIAPVIARRDRMPWTVWLTWEDFVRILGGSAGPVHSPDCGIKYRGCAPDCPKALAEESGDE